MTEHLPVWAVFFSMGLAATALSGCQMMPPIAASTTPAIAIQIPAQTLTPPLQVVVGDYVSAGYAQRKAGYDWTRVTIRAAGHEKIDIRVRSRSDIKTPTCTFDGTATLMGQDVAHGIIFKTTANDSATFLQFKADTLTIDSEDKYALAYFCSGGATLAGEYQKIDE